jgi:hypothetical protein|tara:strand:+ start:2437 stop:3456 length:1020 start_codon:yes stop_codon:yes gene_type:complete
MKLTQAKAICEAAIDFAMNTKNGRDAQYVVPYLVSGAGIGKTTLVKDIAASKGIGCEILSLAQYDAGELGGWAVPSDDGETMVRKRPDWMPTKGKGILFLDELPQAPVSNQNIAAQITNERRVGPHHLPEGWVIVAAGNRMSDRAGTNVMPSHLKDRLMFLEIEADMEDTIAYYYSKRIDERVSAFLRFRPEWLHKFDRDADASPSPRSWERVASIMSWGLDPMNQLEAIAGQVGRAATADFTGFLQMYDSVPDIDALIAAPDAADIPDNPAVLYAVCAAISSRMNPKNAGNVIKYLDRLPQQEFAAFVIKDGVNRHKELKQSKDIRSWIMRQGKNLIL